MVGWWRSRDDEAMTNDTHSVRLERPVDDRSIAGVAAALSRYFNIPVGLVRVGFVIAAFFGGLGLAAYALGWVLIRDEGDDESLLEQWLGNISSPSSWIGLILIGIAVVALASSFGGLSGTAVFALALIVLGVLMYRGTFDDGVPSAATGSTTAGVSVAEPPSSGEPAAESGEDTDLEAARDELDEAVPVPDTGPPPSPPPAIPMTTVPPRPKRPRSNVGRFTYAALLIVLGSMAVADTSGLIEFALSDYFAVALLLVGAGLLVAVLYGRAYSLIFVGLLLVVALQFTSWFDVELGGGFGDPVFNVDSVEELESEYRLLAGELRVDLSDLAPVGDVATEISLGAGELTIEVPDDVNVIVDVRVVAGELNIPTGQVNGTDIDRRVELRPEGATGTLEVDASIGFGQLNVTVSR